MIRRLSSLLLLFPLAGCMGSQYAAPPGVSRPARRGQLSEALYSQKWDLARDLVRRGADVNEGWKWKTPLRMVATRGYNLEMLDWLLAHGADPNLLSPQYPTSPLHVLAGRSSSKNNSSILPMVQSLLDHGADLTVRDYAGRTPLDVALETSAHHASASKEVIDFLRKAEAEGPALRQARLARRKAQREEARLLESNLSSISAAERAGDEAQSAGKSQAAFAYYLKGVKLAPLSTQVGRRLRKKLVGVAAAMSPAPKVPEAARDHMTRGHFLIKRAKTNGGFLKAEKAIMQALDLAPWWAVGWFNMGIVKEKVRDLDGAVESFKLYLLAAPNAKDRKSIKTKLIDLAAQQELKAQ